MALGRLLVQEGQGRTGRKLAARVVVSRQTCTWGLGVGEVVNKPWNLRVVDELGTITTLTQEQELSLGA